MRASRSSSARLSTPQAVAHGRQSVALLERSARQPWLSKVHLVLALSYAPLGEFPAALASATELEAMAEATGDPRSRSLAGLITGQCKAMQGEWEEGIAACQRRLACAPEPFNTALATCFLGHAYFLQGDLAQAHDLAHQGLEISQEIEHGYWIGWAQRVLGRIALACGRLAEADSALHDALSTFAALQGRFEVGRTYLTLAELAQAQGNLAEAATHLSTAHELFDTLQVPYYVERTVQLARAYGVASTRVPA